MIYLDYAANSPVDKDVLDLYYNDMLKYYANPNSSHLLGQEAAQKIKEATSNIAQLLEIKEDEIIYTSGATEANNLVIKGVCERYKNRGKHILLGSLEHTSLVAPASLMQEEGFEVELLPLTKEGLIDLVALQKMLRDDTILVSVTAVDSELGIRQPIEEIGRICQEHPNCVFHSDFSQSFGKIKIAYQNVDLITINPHKFFGLPGIGLLIKKENISLKPQMNGGRSTTIYRSGTPVTASITALALAIQKALREEAKRYQYVAKLSTEITSNLEKYPLVNINRTPNSLPYFINFSITGVKALDLTLAFQKHKIIVSPKTSCCPVGTPSKLVYALTHDKQKSLAAIRVSLAHLTKKEEVAEFIQVFKSIYKELT